MGPFRRSPHGRVSANSLEDAAVSGETGGRFRAVKFFAPFSGKPMAAVISRRRLRARADPEDDGAETLLLEEERHQEEGY